jgi:hypothetical protein
MMFKRIQVNGKNEIRMTMQGMNEKFSRDLVKELNNLGNEELNKSNNEFS